MTPNAGLWPLNRVAPEQGEIGLQVVRQCIGGHLFWTTFKVMDNRVGQYTLKRKPNAPEVGLEPTTP